MSKFIATIERSPSGQIYMVNPYGGPFDMSKHVGKHLYTSDAIALKDAAIAELLEALINLERTSGLATLSNDSVRVEACSVIAKYKKETT